MITIAERLQKLPPYLFVDIREKMQAAQARGVDVISLGIGDPDIPTQSSKVWSTQSKTRKTPTATVMDATILSPIFQRQFAIFTNTDTVSRYPMIRLR